MSSFTGSHLYFNAPNAQGPNGEGDSTILQYDSGEFISGDLIVGINIECYDWNAGALGLTFKALEMRFEDAATTGKPDWQTTGLVNYGLPTQANVFPVPYIWNWPVLNQYGFPNAFLAPLGATTMAVCQYGPGQNQTTGATGGPVTGYDGGPASIDSYGWDALNQAVNGPYTVDHLLCLYGNKAVPDVWPDMRMQNRKYNTDLDDVALIKGAGLKVFLHLVNSLTTPQASLISLWVRAGGWTYQGFGQTGVDVFDSITGGTYFNPIPLVVPTISFSISIPLSVGSLAEFGFSNYTWEAIMAPGTGASFPTQTTVKDTLIVPKGVEDDNGAEIFWAIQTPPLKGDAMAKRFRRELLPSGAFTITHMQWSPSDFNGNGNALYGAELRWEGTLGDGTPDNGGGGLIGTFDPASTSIGSMYLAAVTPVGGPVGAGVYFAAPPVGNIYAQALYNYTLPVNDVFVASDLQGFNHKFELRDTSWSLGDGVSPMAPYNGTADLLIVRMRFDEPLDGALSTVDARPATIADTLPKKVKF
jgi:hypothetical protein